MILSWFALPAALLTAGGGGEPPFTSQPPQADPSPAAPVAPPDRSTPGASGTVAVRNGLGAGAGSPGGLAGAVHLVTDVGLGRHVAIGLEAVAVGSTTLSVFEPAEGDSLRAVRARAVGRLSLGRVSLSTAVAAGPGRITTERSERCPWSDVETNAQCAAHGPNSYLSTERTTRTGLAYALEVAVAGRVGAAQIGGVLRIDGSRDVRALTLGPTFALSF